jgi:hypothetical protein
LAWCELPASCHELIASYDDHSSRALGAGELRLTAGSCDCKFGRAQNGSCGEGCGAGWQVFSGSADMIAKPDCRAEHDAFAAVLKLDCLDRGNAYTLRRECTG